MTRINLLPWRELLRKEREREFYSITAGAAFLMCLVVVYIHFHVAGMIETQNGRNKFLQQEIAKVEDQIKDIKQLENKKTQLLARMKVIEELQGQRPLMVHLFEELVKAIPDGVYLTSIKQTGTSVAIEGIAQSNARVSAFMRNIDASQWLAEPKLNVIQAMSGKGNQKGSTFHLNLKEVIEGDKADMGAGEEVAPNASAAKAKTTSKAAPSVRSHAQAGKQS